MLRSKVTIAGSNFIFNHINEKYNEYLNRKKLESYLEELILIILIKRMFPFLNKKD